MHSSTRPIGRPESADRWNGNQSWLRATEGTDQAAMAAAGWAHVRTLLAAQTHRLYILDEFAHVLNKGWLDVDEVADDLAHRPGTQHVVITGRNCPAGIIGIADIVTSMDNVKHPFGKGERGQAGIEW